jgi:hypothetical protein
VKGPLHDILRNITMLLPPRMDAWAGKGAKP